VNTQRTDTALLLRRHRYGESSLVVHALSRDHGRLHLIAKGAYRPTSGYYGALDLFDTLELSWSANPRTELQVLRGARPVRLRRAVPRDLVRYRCALSALELCDIACRSNHPEPALFRVVERTLDRLARGPGTELDPQLVLLAHDLQFLKAIGLAPALLDCAACAGPAPESGVEDGESARAWFSAGAGGRLCATCAREARSAGRRVGTLPVDVLRIANALGSAEADVLGTYRLTPARRSRVRDFVDRFLEYHLEVRPRTRRAPTRVRAALVPR
jgi:DNA repair protein RecO (recombination protein O)